MRKTKGIKNRLPLTNGHVPVLSPGSSHTVCDRCGKLYNHPSGEIPPLHGAVCPSCVRTPLRIDLGCGPNPREGFVGADQYPFGGKVTHVCNLASSKWPWGDATVEEAHTSHFIEHLDATERVHFCNELYRVLKPGGKCSMIAPHWASCRAYGDPTHKWPPISEFWFYYLSKEWRLANAPHTDLSVWDKGYDCDFEVTWGYSMHPALTVRNQEFQQDAMQWKKEAIQDVQATLTKK